MAYGEPIEDIQDAYDEAAPVVKQEVDDYDNADDYDNVKDKAATVVETETDTYDNGRSYETIAAEAPVVEQSNAEYKGFVTVPEVVRGEDDDINKITIPDQVGVIYVNGYTYDPDNVVPLTPGEITLTLDLKVLAIPAENYKFEENAVTEWVFETEAGLVSAIAAVTNVGNTVTIPTETGVIYINADTGEALDAGDITLDEVDIPELNVQAVPADGYHFDDGLTTSWSFEYAEPEQPEAQLPPSMKENTKL